ncbi:hypothetical protein B4102_3278 [Heyndrickxia sporothermodurans]|uniref:Butirosin biosynthesis protein H N-terminal domain-containing protein n=1 Tax=Heyndrickxia sporothermodurans TaxID=46224 RepID=A0A150KYD5_9BACI|nr:BtrH N-terminal domain-containing protein [Heyndrickxia sporothermodurans]KYD04432.1 hypothetical protein B4102_3278 [Heyndrickxia sporothermodurans]
MEVYHSPYYNCKNLLITAAIKRKGYSIEGLWKKVGFHFDPYSDFIITPYYLSLEDELNSYGFSLNTYYYKDANEFYDALHNYINNQIIVGVGLDLYELPYSMYYNEEHQNHAVEVIGYEEGNFIVLDHYYNYFGNIPEAAFDKAIKSNLENNQQSLQIYFINDNVKENRTENTKEIINENILALEGKRKYINQSDTSITGISGILNFKNRLINEFSRVPSSEQKDEIHELVYPVIKEISYSRYHFKTFIGLLGDEYLSEKLHDISQNWSVLGHLLLKANLSKNYDKMLTRIDNKLEDLYEKENNAVELLQQFMASQKANTN